MKKNIAWIVTICLGILTFAYAMYMAPRTIDWQDSFSLRHKRPLGCKILRDQLHYTFPHCKLTNLYNNFTEIETEFENSQIYNLLLIDRQITLSTHQCKWMMNEAAKGNHILIATEKLPQPLLDTLRIKIVKDTSIQILNLQQVHFSFTHPIDTIGTDFSFTHNITNNYLVGDSLIALSENEKHQPVFAKRVIGKGAIYIHCNPLIFSNYHLLTNQNYAYAFGCLAFMPPVDTYWDEYHKAINRMSVSPIMYIHRHPMLTQAWYFLWLIVLLYFVIEMRRRQRAIPTIHKPANNTLDFVKTMGRLYLSRKDHRDIAIKKYTYFKEFVRRKYHQTADASNQETITLLSGKSGLPIRSIIQIVEMGEKLSTVNQLSESELIRFNRTIEFFYNNCK